MSMYRDYFTTDVYSKKKSLTLILYKSYLVQISTSYKKWHSPKVHKNKDFTAVSWCSSQQYLCRPAQALRAPGVLGSQNSWTVSTWGWQGCQPYTLATFMSHEILQVLISVWGWVDPSANVARRITSMKNPNNPIGNQTNALPAGSTVPTVQPCTPVSCNYD